ncbi:MAG: hypothetical protein ACRDTC_14750 [Pseudonocardiaceae bacterium]
MSTTPPSCARAEILATLILIGVLTDLRTLGDLGYEADTIHRGVHDTCPSSSDHHPAE